MEKEVKEKFIAAATLAHQIETRRKNLDWFDYQVRGKRWPEKSETQIREERKEILDDIKKLESEFSIANKELQSAGGDNGST